MLLGLDTYSHHLAFGRHGDYRPVQCMDLFGFMERVAEYGLRGVQIDPLHLPQADEEYLDALREDAEERGLYLGYGVTTLEPHAIRDALRVCQRLGSRTLRASVIATRDGRGKGIHPVLSTVEDQVRTSVRALEDADVRLALYNQAALKSQELVTLVETIGSTHCGICLDVGGSLCVLEDPVDAAERMVPFAVTAQLRDYAIASTPCGCSISGAPLGQGVLPLQELYRVLEEEGTIEHLVLEVPTEAARGDKHAIDREEAAIRTSIDFCRSVLGVGAAEPGL